MTGWRSGLGAAALGGCAPRTAAPAPTPGVESAWADPAPSPELLGGPPAGEPPLAAGPQPWPATGQDAATGVAAVSPGQALAPEGGAAVAVIGDPALPRAFGALADPATEAAAVATPLVVPPAGPASVLTAPVQAEAVIGDPARPRDFARLDAAASSEAARARVAETAEAVSDGDAREAAPSPSTAGATVEGPRAFAMAPIPNPVDSVGRGDPAAGLLGGPSTRTSPTRSPAGPVRTAASCKSGG